MLSILFVYHKTKKKYQCQNRETTDHDTKTVKLEGVLAKILRALRPLHGEF